MHRTDAHDSRRHAAIVGLLCMASIVADGAQANDPPTRFPADSGATAHAAAHDGYDWKAPPARAPDWRGIRRDTGYFLGYQFVVLGVLYVSPDSVSGWSEEQKDDLGFEKWKENAGDPVRDEDHWWINYVTHPYWGGAYYIRARERGFERGQSFLYSALLSTLFEFGAEALFEQPSYQDLVVTPVAGYLVGYYLFEPLRERIRARPGAPDWTDKTLLFLTDPLGVINVTTDRILGIDADIELQLAPMMMQHCPVTPAMEDCRPRGSADVTLIQGWGLHLRMTW
jgi:hypothetical protein